MVGTSSAAKTFAHLEKRAFLVEYVEILDRYNLR